MAAFLAWVRSGSQVTAASTSRSRKASGTFVAHQIHDFTEIGLAETGLLQQHVQVKLRRSANRDRDGPALEVGDRADVLVRHDAVGAARVIWSQARMHRDPRPARRRSRYPVEAARDRIDLAGEQTGEQGGVIVAPDQLDTSILLWRRSPSPARRTAAR